MRAITTVLIAIAALASPLHAQRQGDTGEGEQLFKLVCAMCHSLTPPMKTAPPISHAAGFYLAKHPDRAAAIKAMVAFLKNPTVEQSLLPVMAVERYGLMPTQSHLSDTQLAAVAAYVLTVADTAHVRREHPPED